MSIPLWYPKAVRRNIAPGTSDPYIVPVVGVLHIAVSDARSLFNFFNGPSGGIESHLYLRKDGTFEQMRAFNREADAQLGGNSWIVKAGTKAEQRFGSISIETQGFGTGSWTAAQQASIKEFLLWARDNLGIPLRQVQTPNPTEVAGGGWGYHSLFTAWNRLGKTCPGKDRIAWFHGVLVPWMLLQRVAPKPAPKPTAAPTIPTEDDPMTVIIAPRGSAYHLTSRGLVWLSDGLGAVEGPYTKVTTDAETWGRYRDLYPPAA